MKFIFTFLIILAPLLNIAQEYTIYPSSSVNINLALDNYDGTQISFKNNTPLDLLLEWELLENNLNNQWDYSLCDYGSCYAGIPAGGSMKPIAAGDSGFLKMNLTPLFYEGSGYVKFIVYAVGSTNAPDTITFNYETLSTSLNKNFSKSSNINIFPNPASEVIHIDNIKEASTVQLSGITGKIIYQANAFSNRKATIPISHLTRGLYFITFKEANGKTVTRKVVIE